MFKNDSSSHNVLQLITQKSISVLAKLSSADETGFQLEEEKRHERERRKVNLLREPRADVV